VFAVRAAADLVLGVVKRAGLFFFATFLAAFLTVFLVAFLVVFLTTFFFAVFFAFVFFLVAFAFDFDFFAFAMSDSFKLLVRTALLERTLLEIFSPKTRFFP